MVVLVIIRVLAALIVPNVLDRADDARTTAAKTDVNNLARALKLYKLDNQRYPTSAQGLQALLTKPTENPIPPNWKRYLDKLPNDPGVSPPVPEPRHQGEIDVFSFGADGPARRRGQECGHRQLGLVAHRASPCLNCWSWWPSWPWLRRASAWPCAMTRIPCWNATPCAWPACWKRRAQSRLSAIPVRWRPTARGFTFDGLLPASCPATGCRPDTVATPTQGVWLGPEPIIGRQHPAAQRRPAHRDTYAGKPMAWALSCHA